MPPPAEPKIYHIVHVDRLASIVGAGHLRSDARMQRRPKPGTTIGMADIKRRRLTSRLDSHPDLRVGDCVPFYFCPRSVMLYVIHMANHPELDYRGGQGPIVHLEADLHETVAWAERKERRWAFTLSNAGSLYFEDRSDLEQLDEINWDAVSARFWSNCKEEKQAEFLVERSFPWKLVRRVGVRSVDTCQRATAAMQAADHRPDVQIRREWYY